MGKWSLSCIVQTAGTIVERVSASTVIDVDVIELLSEFVGGLGIFSESTVNFRGCLGDNAQCEAA
jgi:hypothetical protein